MVETLNDNVIVQNILQKETESVEEDLKIEFSEEIVTCNSYEMNQ